MLYTTVLYEISEKLWYLFADELRTKITSVRKESGSNGGVFIGMLRTDEEQTGNEAVNEALQQAGECVQSFETVIRDLRHIHAAQSSCLASARKKPEVRILHYSSIKFTAKLWI